MRYDFDAIVIGGGPAGAASALLLARSGWRTALCEKAPPGRSKSCGHCLSPRARPLLESLGAFASVRAAALGAPRILHTHLPSGRTVAADLAPASTPIGHDGLLIDRATLDQCLLDHAAAAGVCIRRSTPAAVVSINDDAVSVAVRPPRAPAHVITAALVVGADGLQSAVARDSGLADGARLGRKYGFSFDVPAARGCALTSDVVHMFVGPAGYLGVVRASGDAIHLAGLVSAQPPAARDPFEFAADLARRHASLRELLPNRPRRQDVIDFRAAGPMPRALVRVSRGRIALVGDAAGYHEPFTGEGMTWALESAALLARVAADVNPAEWDERSADRYDALWSSHIGRRRAVCRAVAWALERPALLSSLARAPVGCRAVASHLVRRVTAA